MDHLRAWHFLLAFLVLLGLSQFAVAATGNQGISNNPRQMMLLSGASWQFKGAGRNNQLPEIGTSGFEQGNWTSVTVPHDFQTRTDMSTEQGWYRRDLTIPSSLVGKHLYLVFEGAATIADVYVNGVLLGEHRGAYTRFVFDATDALHPGDGNVVAVKLDNRNKSTRDCLPSLSGLYTVWGGLYRNVWLLATSDLQIDPTYYASPGVFVTPSEITKKSANVDVKVLLRNTGPVSLPATVTAQIVDPAGNVVGSFTNSTVVDSNQRGSVDLIGSVTNPALWSPSAPNLYHAVVQLSSNGVVTDSVTQPLGFHVLAWNFAKGTVKLNGAPYILFGVDLHQEIESKQSAVDPQDLIDNIDTLKDLGVNFVRFAHYPRAALEYDQCDERGIFCWAENGHSHNDIPSPTADTITTEMVEQNYNHPSIIVWSVGNEGNAPPSEREVPVVKALDTTRPVMVANMRCANADYRAINTYPGWYGGDRWTFHPRGLISEIGAGGVVTTHSDYGVESYIVDLYEPEEYQQLVAESDLELAFRHNHGRIGMFTWWTLRDFNDVKYKSWRAVYHHGLNTKGLETYGGYKKDVYYLYRCFLRPNVPTLDITSKEYFLRTGAVDNGIKVYGNAATVTLIVNGRVVSTERNGEYTQSDHLSSYPDMTVDNVFYWPVALHRGKNFVQATDSSGDTDAATIYFYGENGLPELPTSAQLITNLTSSNPNNPAYYMDMPVHAQWPVYDDFDGNADNSLDFIPAPIAGASWLALHRVTKQGEATTVSFTAAKPITVYVIATKTSSTEPFLSDKGFVLDDVPPFQWRGNDMILADAELYSKSVGAGGQVSIPLGDRDAMVLVKGGG